jgi:hypothetical protein
LKNTKIYNVVHNVQQKLNKTTFSLHKRYTETEGKSLQWTMSSSLRSMKEGLTYSKVKTTLTAFPDIKLSCSMNIFLQEKWSTNTPTNMFCSVYEEKMHHIIPALWHHKWAIFGFTFTVERTAAQPCKTNLSKL